MGSHEDITRSQARSSKQKPHPEKRQRPKHHEPRVGSSNPVKATRSTTNRQTSEPPKRTRSTDPDRQQRNVMNREGRVKPTTTRPEDRVQRSTQRREDRPQSRQDRRETRQERKMERRTARIDRREVNRALRENRQEVKRSRRIDRKEAKRLEKERIEREKKEKLSKIVGFSLASAQGIASAILVSVLLMLNMLPFRFMSAIILSLLLLLAIPIVAHILFTHKNLVAKIFSGFMIIVLLVGSYYVYITNHTVGQITNTRPIKIDNMVVAVLASDDAQTIEDARDYNFGVQHTLMGDDTRAIVAEVNRVLGSTIRETELPGVSQQAEALFHGDVQAIIYNEAFTNILNDEIDGFYDNIRIIFEFPIEKEIVKEETPEVVVESDAFAIFLSGDDTRGSLQSTGRSDVNQIMIINPTSHQILMVNTPRDFYVPIPGISNGAPDKLTHAGIYGVNASIATLSELYGIKIPFFVRVNFVAFEKIIDALGGVEVYSEFGFTGFEGLQVRRGLNTFNGSQALQFARERKAVPGGDYTRGANQQAVMKAMIQKAMSPAVLAGANQILASIGANVDTNMTDTQIQDFVRMQLDQGIEWNIVSLGALGTTASMPTFSLGNVRSSVEIPNQASVDFIKSVIQLVYDGEVLTPENSTMPEGI